MKEETTMKLRFTIIMRATFLLLSLTVASGLSATVCGSDIHATDTLQRELTLQREYVPEGKQAQKAYFSPLGRTGSRTLKPIEFARNSYGVSMRVAPRLFEPVANPLAPVPQKEHFSIRLFGGYPARVGLSLGGHANVAEKGTFHLAVEHLSFMEQVLKNKPTSLPFVPENKSHDTDVSLGYTHTLEERLLKVSTNIFHHKHSFYGQVGENATNDPRSAIEFDATFPLYGLWGIQAGVELSPAPLSLSSSWEYSLLANIGFARKQEPNPADGSQFVQHPDFTGFTAPRDNNINELLLEVGGNLAYGFSGSDWSFGLDALYERRGSPTIDVQSGVSVPQYLSLDPYFQYSMPTLFAKAGARIQLVSRGGRSFLLTPDIQVRWQVSDKVSFLFDANGGAQIFGLKEIYEQNRYAYGRSSYSGYNVSDYKVSTGFQLGNFNGFSLQVLGGYEHYIAFSDWQMELLPTLLTQNTQAPRYDIQTPLFRLSNRGQMAVTFLSGSMRYVSPLGLELGAKVRYNNYSAPRVEGQEPLAVAGLPSLLLSIQAGYKFNDKLSLYADFQGEGGISFLTPKSDPATNLVTYSETKVPFLHDLNLRLSYKAHKNLGFSLIGQNLTNDRSARWLHYQRPGTAVIGAVTISF